MLERVGEESLDEMIRYLQAHELESILLLGERARHATARGATTDPLTLLGYRWEGQLVAVQGFFHYGRWVPHFANEVIPADVHQRSMIEDMVIRRVRWIMGVERVVEPLLARLDGRRFRLNYDEHDALCAVDATQLRSHPLAGVRRASPADTEAVAELRRAFESEYFGLPLERVDRAWCVNAAARYVADGAVVVERERRIVAMVAVESLLAQLAHIGAVYTVPRYRGQGLAKGAVAALCQELLRTHPRVTLTVRTDNLPAQRAYAALGFQAVGDYRMARFA